MPFLRKRTARWPNGMSPMGFSNGISRLFVNVVYPVQRGERRKWRRADDQLKYAGMADHIDGPLYHETMGKSGP